MKRTAAAFLPLLLPLAAAGLEFGEVYSDHMVLQSGMPIRISGTAAPREELTGRFQSQPEVRTRADENGKWSLEFPALPPGGPYSVTVRGKEKTLTLSDLLIGEVWICAGQSNMEYPLWSSSKFWRSIGGEEAARTAAYPQIRFLSTPRRTLLPGMEKEPLRMEWKICSPQTISDFSAVGFYFGRQLHRDLRVPVGLIGCYWSGTRIEPWISESAFRTAENREMVWILDTLRANGGAPLKTWPKSPRFRAWEQRFFAQRTAGRFSGWETPAFDDRNWSEVPVPSADPIENRIDGVVKNVTDFGAFVDLGGVDGLLHISEMSWGRVDNPKKLFHVGDQLTVLVKDIHDTKIALSLKFPETNPWANAAEDFAVGKVITGKVARMTDFGAFVELAPGVDALLHVSQISRTHVDKPSDVLKIGQEITAKIVDLNEEEKKISLSMKVLEPEHTEEEVPAEAVDAEDAE